MAYTKAQEARITAEAPITYAKAEALGVELGYSTKSVISKTQHLKLEYIKKEVPAPKEAQATKAEILASIEARSNTKLPGLIGATRDALIDLENAIEYIKANG